MLSKNFRHKYNESNKSNNIDYLFKQAVYFYVQIAGYGVISDTYESEKKEVIVFVVDDLEETYLIKQENNKIVLYNIIRGKIDEYSSIDEFSKDHDITELDPVDWTPVKNWTIPNFADSI